MIEILSTEERSLENPSSSLANADEWVFDAFGGQKTSAGIRVSRQVALTYSAVKRAVDMISRDVSKLPLNVFRRVGALSRDRDTTHPAYRLLRWKPNPEMVASKWKALILNHVLIEGNHYSFVLRDGAGRPLEIWPLSPDMTFPVRDNGELFYSTVVDGGTVFLLPEDVIHVIGISFDGRIGLRLINLARDSLGHGIAMERYGGKFFANSAKPGVVIEHPGAINEEAEQRLRKSWDRMHSGLENSHRTAVLEEGAKLSQFSINAKDAQLIESQEFNVKQVANWFNLPPHKLGDDTRTSYASLEQENQSYLNESLDPWLLQIEEVCRDVLLTEREKDEDSHFVEFNRNALVRADIAARTAFYTAALGGAPFMTRNEVRARENLNEIEGGDEILDPLNMGGEPSADGESGTRAMDVDRILGAAERDYRARCLARLQVHAERAAKEPRKFLDWIDSLENLNRQSLESIMPESLFIAKRPVDLSGLFGEVRQAMLAAAECQPAELPEKVRAAFEKLKGD